MGTAFYHLLNTHLLCKYEGSVARLFIQTQGTSNSKRMQNIVQNVEIIQQLEVLKHKPYMGDTEIPALCIVEAADRNLRDLDVTSKRYSNSRNQIE